MVLANRFGGRQLILYEQGVCKYAGYIYSESDRMQVKMHKLWSEQKAQKCKIEQNDS